MSRVRVGALSGYSAIRRYSAEASRRMRAKSTKGRGWVERESTHSYSAAVIFLIGRRIKKREKR